MELNAKVSVEPNRFRVCTISADGEETFMSGVFKNVGDAYELATGIREHLAALSSVASIVIKQWYCTEEEVLTRWPKATNSCMNN